MIQQTLESIQVRVSNIENGNNPGESQIDSSSTSKQALIKDFKKEIKPYVDRGEQNHQDLQTLQHLVGII